MHTPNSEADDLPDDVGAKARTADLSYPAIPADPEQLILLRDEIAVWASRAGLRPEQVSDLQLAVYEAMANVVVHAYPEATGTLAVHARSRGETVTVTVVDHGQWQPAARPGLLHGRGLPLIRSLADRSVVNAGPAGTTVTMTWHRTASA
jgi:anti-sigma regulatory factor (Ser/Thr protein kinase)